MENKIDNKSRIGENKDINFERGKIMANDRFERVYTQGAINVTEIWVDRETGVNYMYHCAGQSGGLTPLLDRDGNPIISPRQ